MHAQVVVRQPLPTAPACTCAHAVLGADLGTRMSCTTNSCCTTCTCCQIFFLAQLAATAACPLFATSLHT